MHCPSSYALRALLLSGLFAAAASLPASSQTCMQDVYSLTNTQTLNCTANDVQLAAVQGVRVINVDPVTKVKTLSSSNQCIAGTTFDFLADFEVVTTSNKTRSNIGLYFGTGATASTPPPNQNGAMTGTCTDSIIAPSHTCAGTWSGIAPICGSDHYDELDPSPDTCGDTSSNDTSSAYPGKSGAQGVTIEIDNVTCPTSGSTVMLPECTSWQVPGKQLLCESPGTDYPFQNSAIAGSPSKCSCGTLSIPVQPVHPGVSVAKSCSTALTPNTANDPTVICDAGAEGSTVTYTVDITNKSDNGSADVDQICDDQYGTVYDDGTLKNPDGSAKTCPAGKLGSIVSGSASSCATLASSPISTSASCTFQAVQGENADVKDTVTVSGHSSLVTTNLFGPTASNQVEVTSSDAPTTAVTNKGYGTPVFGYSCVTVRYNVTLSNTSGADESITLNSSSSPTYLPALNDSVFGDITKLTPNGSISVPGSVLGTTCGVAGGSKGLGTLNGVTVTDCNGGTAGSCNGGAFPQTLAAGSGTPPVGGGSYTCQFDGVVCGTPTVITGVCSAGLTNTDTVTANLTGDEVSPAPADSITQTENPFTANICLSGN